MIEAVIFDFDGVIADSEELHFRAFNAVLAAYGIRLDKKVYWNKYLGFTDKDAYEHINIDYELGFDEKKIDAMIDEKAVVFDDLVDKEGVIINGVFDFLKTLEEEGADTAVCSGAILSDIESVFRATLKRTGLDIAKYFRTIVTADDVTKGKPSPEGYLLTLKKLNKITGKHLIPQQIIAVEDSHWGIEAAKNAGFKVLAVTNSYDKSELEAVADIVVDTLKGLSLRELRKNLD
jgi:beta-phosphoglucomutase